MKHLMTIGLLCLVSLNLWAQPHDLMPLSPMQADIQYPEDDRLIEPTSPILGKNLVERIRKDPRHPSLILNDLKREYPGILRDLQLSSMTYFKTLVGPLHQYCTTEKKEEANDKSIEVVETAAIPIQVLTPLHTKYLNNLFKLRTNYVEVSDEDIKHKAKLTALEYQAERYNCNVVKQLEVMESKAKKLLPRRLDRLVDLHSRISAAEAAFPRIQFSVNGFTQYVFGELLKLPIDQLSGLLSEVYEGQVEWIELREKGQMSERYFTYINNKALAAGFLPRDILMVLAYSTRNMPSLDVQYGYDTEKALILETYFWKFHNHRNYVTKNFEQDIFPNAVMKRNPGLYHYATSALLACDVRLHGYSGVMARVIALGNKIGYKVHKLLGEISAKDGKRPKLKEIMATAKRQAFGPGVDAGKYGGSYGLKFCRKNTPKEFWLKKTNYSAEDRLNSDLDSELEAEDFSAEVEEAL
jgi:hypothetical protein